MDIKKIGHIPDGGGWRAHGREVGSTAAQKKARIGFDYVPFENGGRQGALALLRGIERELRTALLLIGARDVAAARERPRLLRGDLRSWAELVQA